MVGREHIDEFAGFDEGLAVLGCTVRGERLPYDEWAVFEAVS
jgi:hypothetical protein